MGQFKCSRCGQIHNITPVSSTWTAKVQAFGMRGNDAASLQPLPPEPRYVPMQTYAPVVQPGARIETPVAQQNIESNVKVPLAQALVTGGIIGCATFCATTSAVIFFDLPKPILLTIAPALLATLRAVYSTWKGGVNMADSLLTRIEDYTGIDINNDGKVGNRKPAPELRFVSVRGQGSMDNVPLYEPEQEEQYVNIPGMPRADVDPWTVERLVDVLNRAFISNRWSRSYCTELGMSQGQWSALNKYLGDEGAFKIWGTTDRPTLDAFVEQISNGIIKPTNPTNRE